MVSRPISGTAHVTCSAASAFVIDATCASSSADAAPVSAATEPTAHIDALVTAAADATGHPNTAPASLEVAITPELVAATALASLGDPPQP
jgi:hypothetical protein